METQNMLLTQEGNGEKISICDCSRSNRMLSTDQITKILTHIVRQTSLFFFVEILTIVEKLFQNEF